MGLCKCPKKKVTNLFCFEHTVNVCEHCLVANHSKCVVQSYLQWLQDSDYDPACRLCGKNLADESCGPCVRLLCYDLFHWSCLDRYERSLPANTAPAGFTCPVCNAGLFPPQKAASPVVDALRELLSKVNWARAGLGLPLIDEPGAPPNQQSLNASPGQIANASHSMPASSAHYNNVADGSYHMTNVLPQQSILPMDETTPYSRVVDRSELLFDPPFAGSMNKLNDSDSDKYKRRPAFQWLPRWLSSGVSLGNRHRNPNAKTKKTVVILLLCIIGFVTLILIFTRLGRWSAEDDPFLDPLANPNVRVRGD